MTFTRQFSAIPDVQQLATDHGTKQALIALKQNVELICGLRGVDDGHLALVRGDITTAVGQPPQGTYTGASVNMDAAGPYGFVPTITDYIALANQVTLLQNTVAAILLAMGSTR